MIVNDATVRAEVEAAFATYERALLDNDLDVLHAMFWHSTLVVRFGPGQNLYGIVAIDAFRRARIGGSPPRALSNTVITSFGQNFATANTEFQRADGSAPGRQSQSWVRLPEGWRIVSAHVSLCQQGS